MQKNLVNIVIAVLAAIAFVCSITLGYMLGG